MATALAVACVLAAAGGAAARAVGQKTRALTREEILAAIERTLRTNGSTADLTPNEVQLTGEVPVREDAPRLQVTQIQIAPDGTTSRVLMWVASEPRVPPFWVRVDRAIHLGGSTASAKHKPEALIGATVGASAPSQPSAFFRVSERAMAEGSHAQSEVEAVLVKAGEPVALVVEVNGLRIQGTGIPLERGRKGDEVRVRAVPSGRIVVGAVVSDHTVQVSF